jgi:gliding motility-associated-like protein
MGCGGLSSSAVVSTTGQVLNQDGLTNTGMMKVSPDGKLLCQTHFPAFDDGTGGVGFNYFQLFDFDNSTGIISNARIINPPSTRMNVCEFSPNSKLLYISRIYDKKIDQYDVSIPTPAAILASRFTFSTTVSFYGIQLAPDQKIYLATPSRFLGVITNPNMAGAGCGFIKDALDISEDIGGQVYAGLPNFINDLSFDGNNGFTYTILDSCTGRVQFNGFSTIPGALSWDWDFGDGFTDNTQNPIHSFPPANPRYTIKLKIQSPTGCGTLERTKEIIPKGLILNADFDFVAKCDSGYVRFTNTSVFLPDTARIQYIWDFGDTGISSLSNPIHPYSPGNYNVRLTVKTTTGCLDQSVSKPINLSAVDVQAPADQEIDPGASVILPTTGNGTHFTWTPSTGLSSATVSNPVARPTFSTMYVVTAFNDAGCKDMDSVFVKVKYPPGIYVPTGFTPNNDGKNDVFRPIMSELFILQEFSIYNRWGQKIYTTSQFNAGWNGKINGITQDSDVYVWVVNALDTVTGKRVEKKGTFVILR